LMLGYSVAATYSMLESYRVLAAKDDLQQRDVALGIDPAAYERRNYAAVHEYVRSLMPLLDEATRDSSGLRWTMLETSVLFDFERILPIPFDAFVSRVDVSKGIQFMNDYIGGRVIVVERDDQQRVILQAERNLYLPQPNYIAASGGKCIDVTKLECVEYADDVHALYWRTIKSENGSARYDDGTVSFARTSDGETRVTVFGRQEFKLPPMWEFVNLPTYAALKRFLVTQAYRVFFSRTFANFEAVAEGRDVRIGNAPDPLRGEAGGSTPPSFDVATDAVTAAIAFVSQLRTGAKNALIGAHSDELRGEVDADGFVHIAGVSSAAASANAHDDDSGALRFAREFFEMLQRDFAGGIHA
jgi:hypothetical protein